MTSLRRNFPVFRRACLDHFQQKVLPLLADGRPGHQWTGRLELTGIVARIDDWMETHGTDIEAIALRNEFRAMPQAQFPIDTCIAALRAETAKWNAR